MTLEEEVVYLKEIIRKLIFSNVQRDWSDDKFYLFYGVYTIKLNCYEDKSMSDSVDYFIEQIVQITNNHETKELKECK